MNAESTAQGDRVEHVVNVGDVILGKYKVTAFLGRGGMGEVVAARHLELDRLVALKFLLPEARESASISARFASEGRTASRIKNAHVALVHDVGALPDGTPFIVMEHLIGEDLASLLRRRGQLPVAEAADLLMQACEAIAVAHGLGIVHRDIKPGNLFATEDGTFVKVLDFGISKTTTDDVSRTGGAHFLGSPLYMSPEQIGAPGMVDARADVWALGVVLYEMLAGAPPFPGDSSSAVREAILTGEHLPLSKHRPDLAEPLEQLVSDALAKNRELRLSSVEAFAAQLAPFGTDAAQVSLAAIRGIVARASRASGAATGETPTPSAGGGGAPTASVQGTEPGLARSAGKTGPRPTRWRWAAWFGVATVTVAAAVSAVLVFTGHAPWDRAARRIVALEAKCAAEDPESCFQLARILDIGKEAPRDVARAASLYPMACDAGVAAACNNLGALYGAGDGVATDPPRAVALYKKSCELGFAMACANLGSMYFKGTGLPKSEADGVVWFSRACEAGEAVGCFDTSIAYLKGQGVPPDAKLSFAYAERACKGGFVRGCIRMENARISGEGVQKDVQAGLAQLDALCAHEAEACMSLVPIYYLGVGTDVPPNPPRVRTYAKKACDLGDKEACDVDRLLLTIDQGKTTAGQINEMKARQCDAGDLPACGFLGENLIEGRGVSVDKVRGIALLEKACKGKVERACTRLERARGK